MTRTRAIALVAFGAMLIQVGGTLGLIAVGFGGPVVTLPTLVAVVFAGLSIGEVVSRYGRKADHRARPTA